MKIIICCLFSFILIGCPPNPISVPPDIPIGQLLTSPDTIVVMGGKLFLTTYLWRDFQPISPPDGKPLIALAWVAPTDSRQLPHSLGMDAIWIINGQEAWRSDFTNEPVSPDPLHPNSIGRIARNGPKWGPGISVTVVVRVTDGYGNVYLLRASNQMIHRTD